MTLKTFHLVFILIVIVGAEMFAGWALYHYPGNHDPQLLWMAIPTLLGGLGLCVYAYFFVRKMDREGIA